MDRRELPALLEELRDDLFPNTDKSDLGVNMQSPDGTTPLHVAAIRNDLHLAKLLLDAGANIEARSEEGYTPLLEAAAQGAQDVYLLLVNSGANTKAVNDNGQTAEDLLTVVGES